jgi:putative flavoprotein involved in K+ transport
MAAQQAGGTIVIGAGQAGLATAFHLARLGVACEVLEKGEPGDSWRHRWDSLKLFTPAQHCSLPGRRFPAPRGSFPAGDQTAEYLKDYAADLAVTPGVTVTALRSSSRGFELETSRGTRSAAQVVVATGATSVPRIPALSRQLAPELRQLHSSDYRNPGSVTDGGVLVVGSGTSGVQIAIELAATRAVWLAGKAPVHVPDPLLKYAGALYWQFIHRALTRRTPLGRKLAPKVVAHGAPLISVSTGDAEHAGVVLLPRLEAVTDRGLPSFAGQSVPAISTVIWATGFRPDYAWIGALERDGNGWPLTDRGAAAGLPGLFFVGLPFQFGLTSPLLGGVGRDARHVAGRVAAAQRAM